MGGETGEMTTQTQLDRADPCLGDLPRPGPGLFNVQQVIFIFPSFLNLCAAWYETSTSRAAGHRAVLAKLHPLQKHVIRADEGSQFVSNDMDLSPIPHYMAPAILGFAICWCPVNSPAAPVHSCSLLPAPAYPGPSHSLNVVL